MSGRCLDDDGSQETYHGPPAIGDLNIPRVAAHITVMQSGTTTTSSHLFNIEVGLLTQVS
jgi:hypothetical protein